MKRYGDLSHAELSSLFELANRGLTAGSTLTSQANQLISNSGIRNSLGQFASSSQIARVLSAMSVSTTGNTELSSQLAKLDKQVPIELLPYVTELFGDNPERNRAVLVTHQSAVKGRKPARLDVKLAGGETWRELVDRAISWREYIKDYDPYRFDDMDEEEIFDLSLTIVAGYRKF